MNKLLHLSIVDLHSSIFDGDVDNIVLETTYGELCILPGHMPLLATLRPGLLKYTSNNNSSILAISGGFVEVINNEVIVAADLINQDENLDVDTVLSEQKELMDTTTASSKLDNYNKFLLELSVARLKLLRLKK